MPELSGMAPITGAGLPPTTTTAEIAPCFSRSMAAVLSRLEASTSTRRALNSAAAVTAEAEPGGPKFTCRPDRSGDPADIGPGKNVNLLRGEPGHEFEPVAEGHVLGDCFGQDVGRDKGKIDVRGVETCKIGGAGIAQDGKDAQDRLAERGSPYRPRTRSPKQPPDRQPIQAKTSRPERRPQPYRRPQRVRSQQARRERD